MPKLRVGDWAFVSEKGAYMDILPNTLVEVVEDDNTILAPLAFIPLLYTANHVRYWAAREGDLIKIDVALQEAPHAPAAAPPSEVPHTEGRLQEPR